MHTKLLPQIITRCLKIIPPLPIANHIVLQPYPIPQFLLHNVTFVKEENYVGVFQELVGADRRPNDYAVF
jgi:hypothetical protein